MVDWRDVIVKGETGTVLIVANTTAQAKIAFAHVVAVFEESPALRGTVTRCTADTLELVRTASHRDLRDSCNHISSRRPSCIGVLLEEFAFYECREDLRQTDTELILALALTLLTTCGPLIMISSAFLAEGEFWKSCTNNWGRRRRPCPRDPRPKSRTQSAPTQ